MRKKRLLIPAFILVAALMFGIGAGAAFTWMTYDGDTKQSEDHVDEIMDILDQVNTDKITAEEALAKIEEIDIDALKQRIKDLENELSRKQEEIGNKQKEIDDKNREINDKNKVIESKDHEIKDLNDYVRHLEGELVKANDAVNALNNKTQKAVESAREYIK